MSPSRGLSKVTTYATALQALFWTHQSYISEHNQKKNLLIQDLHGKKRVHDARAHDK